MQAWVSQKQTAFGQLVDIWRTHVEIARRIRVEFAPEAGQLRPQIVGDQIKDAHSLRRFAVRVQLVFPRGIVRAYSFSRAR